MSPNVPLRNRGRFRNDIYFGTIGFLPRVEFSFRVTAIPGLMKFAAEDSLTTYTDADRMLSLKVQLLRQSGILPDVAAGMEDIQGTRRFHTGYLVAGRDWRAGRVRLRADAGLARATEVLWWRTASGTEVDFVIEQGRKLVAVEVKSTATPRSSDARQLAAFRDEYGSAVHGCLLLHTGAEVTPIGRGILAAPWWRVI